jgi:hypothetical protein
VSVPVSTTADGVTFAVRVVPRSSRSFVAGTRGDALLVRLTAPPVEGAANDALVALLASVFDRPKRDISIVSGGTSKDKRVAVAGLSAAEVTSRLSAILGKQP